MMDKLAGFIDKLLHPHINPPKMVEIDGHLPTEAEKRWAKREIEATMHRARELGIFVDLHKTDG